VHYSKASSEAESVAHQIRSDGGLAETVAGDLSQKDGPHQLADKVKTLVGNRLDILVANAGVSSAAPIAETQVDEFDRLYAVNVRAPYFLVQQLLPVLGADSAIIFTSSLAAHAALKNLSAYAATKGAIDTLVRQMAAELGPQGIRVNAVAPGVVETDMSNFTKTEAGRNTALGMQALKRIAQPDDIGGVVVFLAGPDARWITGHTLNADGGSKL
jgi:3-oxoacyl-[acyl-carrier protein] reductase